MSGDPAASAVGVASGAVSLLRRDRSARPVSFAARGPSSVGSPASLGVDAAGRLAEAILCDALRRRAEAVHLETERDGLSLRLYVDGAVYEKPHFKSHLPSDLGPRLIERFASFSGLPASAPRKGVLRIFLDGVDVWLRIALCPTSHGHRLILRPVYPALPLDSLGLEAEAVHGLRQVLALPHGLVLVAGPPRSGRTTTLRALVAAILDDRPKLAIDPGREFVADGVRRLGVGSETGLSVPWGIRAVTDHSPGVLVVDEIRDGPAAAAAVDAALAGHLVLAAVPSDDHWPDAAMLATERVDPLALTEALAAVSVQRLVRKPCPKCRQPADSDTLAAVGIHGDRTGGAFGPGTGCSTCRRSGYAGRTGLFCGLRASVADLAALSIEWPVETVGWPARAMGAKSLKDAGREAVRSGVTTPEEVLRVLGRR